MTDPCIVDGYTLTIADQAFAKKAIKGKSGDGQGALLEALAKTPIAKSEFSQGRPKMNFIDAQHLSRYDETNYVQWYARHGDGMFHPLGRIMLMIAVG